MWYNHLNEYLLSKRLFTHTYSLRNQQLDFSIVIIYVDDLSFVGTPKEIIRITNYLKRGI